MSNRISVLKMVLMVALFVATAKHIDVAFAGQGAGRMLYSVATNSFIENPAGDVGVKTINDTSGSIATLQSNINSTRSSFPNSIIVIRLTNNATYWISNVSLVLGSRQCLVASGAVIKATNASVTVPLIQITSGATNVSIAGGRLDGSGASLFGIFAPTADRVNVDRVAVVNCGAGGISLGGRGNTNFDNELTVTRCEVFNCTNQAGISITNATQAVCLENFCHHNGAGISLSSARSTIANNVCNQNGTGIVFLNGSDNVIANNTCNYNGTGILADGTNTMVVSCLMKSNTVAGINSTGSKNIFVDNICREGNGTNFINSGSSDKVVAYKSLFNAAGQTYFYPPLIDDQHTNLIVNGKGRTDLTITSTTIDSVQTQYTNALATNPTDVIVLHLNGTFTVGANPLTLFSNTCVLLNGTIQVNGSTTASAVINDGTSPDQISISGGIIDGGNNTNIAGISFDNSSMAQVDSVRLQNFGAPNPRGASDIIHFTGCSTPMIVTRCVITNGSARGVWLQQSSGKCLISDNDVSFVNMDGVDCDSFTSGAVVKFNNCHDSIRTGVFIEQGAQNNLALGNICNNIATDGINVNNSSLPGSNLAYNSVIGNWCYALGRYALRNASSDAATTNSHNFFFNNTLVNSTNSIISSQRYGSGNYFCQNFTNGGLTISSSGAGAENFFNPPAADVYLNIQDASSFLFALVTNASTANGAAIITGFTNSLASDQWQLIPTDSGYFQIRNKNSGKAMNVTGAALSSGALVSQQTFGALKSDQWLPVSSGTGCYNFINRLSGLYLDVTGSSVNPGTQFDQQIFSGAANQQFNLNSTALMPPPASLNFTIIGTTLQLQWPANYAGWVLQSQINSMITGLRTNWTDVTGSVLTNQWSASLQATNAAAFFRLRSP